MKRSVRSAVLAAHAAVLALGLGGVIGHAAAQPFTYQGKLTDLGGPANGLYDMQFQVYPQLLGGLQIGFTDVRNGVSVTDGLFTTEVDAINGAVIGPDLYLEIAVRRSGSGAAFTQLAGRTRITVSPLAQRSVNERWSPANATTIRTDSGITTLLVNRNAPIFTDSILTLSRATTPANSYAGMYVDGTNAATNAYYGWAVGGVSKAEAVVAGTTGIFSLNVGGATAIFATPTGQVGIATLPVGSERLRILGDTVGTGNVTAANFVYSTPRTRRTSVHGVSLQSVVGANAASVERGTAGAGFAATIGSSTLMMSVSLPDGASVTKVTYYATDNSVEALTLSLLRTDHFASSATIVSTLSTTGAAAGIRAFADTGPSPAVIDNSLYSYYLTANCVDWGGLAVTSLKSVTIEYTVPGPD